jgi:hypothetical protein
LKSLLQSEQTEKTIRREPTLGRQAAAFFLHTVLALAVWLALMLGGYALNPSGVSQWMILALSMAIPLVVGLLLNLIHPVKMATFVWLAGAMWMMVFSQYVLDLPTGPGHCYGCDAIEKLARTFLSQPRSSGLIALLGYSIGAWLGGRRKE